MSGRNQHVVHKGNQWAVKGENNNRVTSYHNTQSEAINSAREICKNQGSELFIHGKNNQFRERNSYGNDPFPPKG